MASYGEVTVREILESRSLRLEIAAMLDMKERAILRDVSGEDEGKTLDDLYEPIPGDLETLNVADARGDDETIARIARHTGLPTGSVEDILERTHGRTLPSTSSG